MSKKIIFIFFLVINVFAIYSFASTDITFSDDSSFSFNFDFPIDDYNDCIMIRRKGTSVFDIYTFNFEVNNPPVIRFSSSGGYTLLFSGSYFTHNKYVYNSKLTLSEKVIGNGNMPSYDNSIVGNYEMLCNSIIFYSTCDIYDYVGSSVLNPRFNNPSFITSKEELASGKFDTLRIDAGDLDLASDEFVFNIYSGINLGNNSYDYTSVKSFLLDSDSSFLHAADLNLFYFIPQSRLGIDFSNDKHYLFELKEKGGDKVYNSVSFTVGGLTSDEEIKNAQDVTNDKLDEQTEAIKNQTETNKGIWETIKDILSYINPFSENFFVYKLLELLGDMLKALFVPSEEFMSQWFTDISDYFEDAFGILYYPIDLVIQVLGRFSNIADQEPVISFGNFSLFGGVIIPAYSFNFNSLLTNNVLKTLHDFYLIVIDVILWFGLLVYCKNVVANIFGGKFTDDVIDDIQDNDYARYSNYQANKQRYKEEHGGGKR